MANFEKLSFLVVATFKASNLLTFEKLLCSRYYFKNE